MKTTVEIADAIYNQIKARAALKGQTVKAFFLEALQDKLAAEAGRKKGPSGWRTVFGKAPAKAVNSVQAILDEEFSKINPEDWK